jgi:Uma2 family endonuclease
MAEQAYPLAFLDGDEGQAWPAQGEWTYEDYLRLPDDGRRYEVIRGYLYVTAAPPFEHQHSVTQFTLKLGNFVSERRLGLVLVAPFDILLPERIGDPVEPDILYFRPENRPRRGDKNFQGVPDLVVEVLSPRTRLYDRNIKLSAYAEAGIPEYWLVDPWARTVEIFGFRDGGKSYVELARGGPCETVSSFVIPGFQVAVDDLFLNEEE